MTARDREVGPLISALLFVTLAELMLLGSGRLIQFGPLTLRMYLYLICLVTGLLLVLKRGAVDRDLALLSLAFVGLTAWSAAVGLVNHARMEQVVEDVKPLLFFPIVFFFASTIRTVEQVHRVGTVIRFCSLVLAVAYILALVLIALRIIPFRAVYEVLSQSGEFFFRGHSGAFYKGFLYLGVGFCFFLTGTRRSTILAGLLFLAIALTFTRGMLLATVLTAGIAAALHRRSGVRLPIYLGTLLVSLSLALPWLARVFADRARSDVVRLTDARIVGESTTWLSLLVGHGLGTSVGSRERIEASYLELLHQQGMLGLLFWGWVAVLVARAYFRARRAGHDAEAQAFSLAAMFVYLESATNPFLTNPIGMSMVLVALVALRCLAGLPRLPGGGTGDGVIARERGAPPPSGTEVEPSHVLV